MKKSSTLIKKHKLALVKKKCDEPAALDAQDIFAFCKNKPELEDILASAEHHGHSWQNVLLALAFETAFADTKMAHVMLKMAEKENDETVYVHDDVFHSMRTAVLFHICQCMASKTCNPIRHRDMEDAFDDRVEDLIPGAKLLTQGYPNNPKYYVDKWIRLGSDIIPVELKPKDVTLAGVRQIKKYVDFYESSQGFIIGPRIKDSALPLPKDITFIQMNLQC